MKSVPRPNQGTQAYVVKYLEIVEYFHSGFYPPSMEIEWKQTQTDCNSRHQNDRVIALLTDNVVLALDIQEALKSAGFTSMRIGNSEFKQLKNSKQPDLAAAIIDLGRGATKATIVVKWLAQECVPTFVIAADGEVLRGVEQLPNVVARTEVPFNIDAILPRVVSATKA